MHRPKPATWFSSMVKLVLHPANDQKPFDEYSIAVWDPVSDPAAEQQPDINWNIIWSGGPDAQEALTHLKQVSRDPMTFILP